MPDLAYVFGMALCTFFHPTQQMASSLQPDMHSAGILSNALGATDIFQESKHDRQNVDRVFRLQWLVDPSKRAGNLIRTSKSLR